MDEIFYELGYIGIGAILGYWIGVKLRKEADKHES